MEMTIRDTLAAPDFDDLNPILKIEALFPADSKLKADGELLIVALLAVDLELRQVFSLKGNSLYVLSDSSIKELVFRTLGRHLDQSCFAFVTYTQLIYRFTVATKFDVSISKEKQLRINSWGVKYYSEFLERSHQEILEALRAEFRKTLDEYQHLYSDLVGMLKMPGIDLLTASHIKNINQCLSFKLVA